jgi:hypothetical protein
MKNMAAASLSVPTVRTDGSVGGVVPRVISFDNDPTTNGVNAPVGSLGLRTDSPSVWIKVGPASTAWNRLNTATPPPPGAALSLERTFLGTRDTPVSKNLSDEGTVDWFAPVNAPATAYGSRWEVGGTGGSHEKLGALGYLSLGASYLANGVPYNLVGPAGTDFARSTNDDDDNCPVKLSGDSSYNGIVSRSLNANGRGSGVRLVVPAVSTQCVLRVYTEQVICAVTCHASLLGSSPTSETLAFATDLNVVPAGPTNSQFCMNEWKISYRSESASWLEVLFLMTELPDPNYGLASWVALLSATIATT